MMIYIIYISQPVIGFYFRNWKYEQEIAGLLWKVDKAEIHASLSGHKNAEFVMDQDKKDAYGSKVMQNKAPTRFRLIERRIFWKIFGFLGLSSTDVLLNLNIIQLFLNNAK